MVSLEHPNLISIMDIEKLSHDESGALQGGFRVVSPKAASEGLVNGNCVTDHGILYNGNCGSCSSHCGASQETTTQPEKP